MTTFTNVPTGYPVVLAALIEGHASQSVWNFADGLTLTNRPYTSHAWAVPGDYAVVLRAYNETNPGGVSATVTVHVVTQPVHYVSATSVNPVPPYNSWATAATNIQDAIAAGTDAGRIVLVTNGVYRTRGVWTEGPNLVALTNQVMLRSVNGPAATIIDTPSSQKTSCRSSTATSCSASPTVPGSAT